MTPLRMCICGATALSLLLPLAILLLYVLRAARLRDLWEACWLAAAAWALVAIVWLVGVR